MTNPSEYRPAVGVLLAAGSGSRLGRGPKALLRMNDGRSLLDSALAALLEGGCERVMVVLGAEAESVAAACEEDQRTTVLVNRRWRTGMGSSFALGMGVVPAGVAALVALVDQPGLNATLVRRILQRHRPGRIVAAGYRRESERLRRGHPVLFASEHVRPAAAAATGDAGGRSYVAARPDLVDLVDCTDLDSGLDIDTVADLGLLGGA